MQRCFDIGGTHIVVADVSTDGQLHEIARLATPTRSFEEFTKALKKYCPANAASPDSALYSAEDSMQRSAVGISIAGVIQPQSGIIQSANIPCVSGRPLQETLCAALGVDVHVINDADAFALAESTFGQAKNHAIVLAIILGTGIGGGIVLNNQLLKGATGTAGEWGHGSISLTRKDYLSPEFSLPELACNCGQARCLDSYAGAIGLQHLFEHIDGRTLTSIDIVEAWQNEEPMAIRVIDVWLDIVGGALANVVNFLDPSIVVVGGGLANAHTLIAALDKEVNVRRLVHQAEPLLHAAAHGPEQGLLGASVYSMNLQ